MSFDSLLKINTCKIKQEVLQDDEELCRLCAEKSSEYSSIFDDNLHESLTQNFRLSINPADNWPKSVCRKCSDTANVCLDFLSNIREAETTLRNIYGDLVEVVSLKSDIEVNDVKEFPQIPPPDPTSDSSDFGQDSAEAPTSPGVENSSSRCLRRRTAKGNRKQVKPVKVRKIPENFDELQIEENVVVKEDKDDEDDEQNERTLRLRNRKQQLEMEKPEKSSKKGRRSLADLKNEDERIEQFFKLDCSICSEPFAKWQEMRVHFKRTHKQDAYIVCCKKKLSNRIAIITHLNGHTNPDAYKCTLCNRAFLNESRLNLHNLNKHIPVEQHKYKCPKCPKTFMILSCMNIHQAMHMTEDEKKFKCPHCQKAFAFNSMMRQHIRNIHQGGERYVCEICAKEIKGKHTYEIHVNNHKIKGVGHLSCPICEKKFKRKRLLKDHIDRHNPSGETFKCNVCGRYSPNRFALKRHIENTHLDLRKYECTSCDGAFKTKIALREHTATHHGTFYALYTCLFCDKQFNSSSNRYVHQKQKHPVEYQEMRQKKLLKERGVLDAEK